jgi:hypothetical protein
MFISVAGITGQIDLRLAFAFYSRPGSSGLAALILFRKLVGLMTIPV